MLEKSLGGANSTRGVGSLHSSVVPSLHLQFWEATPSNRPFRAPTPIAPARPHRVFLETPPFLRKARVTMGDKELAIELKNKGNAAFKAHDWPTALDFYTKAIEKYDQEPSFYTNRAQVCSLIAAREHSFTSLHRPT